MRRAGLPALLAATLVAVAPEGSPAQPPQTVAVKASRRGFQPSSLSLRRGETTRLVLSSADGGEHCFAVDELRIEKRIVPGREIRFDLTPEKTGSYRFYCCLEQGEAARAERGQLTVAE